MRGEVHELAAIEERDDFHAGRQDLVVQLFNFFVNGKKSFVGVGAFAEQDDAFDDVVVVNNGAIVFVNGLADLSEADARALGDGGDVFHAKDGAIFGGDGGLFDVRDVGEEADYADVDLLEARFDEAATGVGIIVRELLFDLADAEAVGDEGVGINADLIFAGDAAEAGDVNDIGHGLELLFERPVLDGLQFHEVVFRDWCCAACTNKFGLRDSSPCPSAAAGRWAG